MREMKEKRIRHRAKHKESEEASKDAHTDGEMRGNPYRMQMFSFQEIKSTIRLVIRTVLWCREEANM